MPKAVGSICQRELDVIGQDDTVEYAAERMLQRSVGTLLIVDADNRPAGIVTDRDLTLRVLAQRRDPAQTAVGDVMTGAVDCIKEDASLDAAIEAMRARCCRRLPVTGAKGVLVGIVALDDIVMEMGRNLAEIGDLLNRETPAVGAVS